jgi:hypothetical protein
MSIDLGEDTTRSVNLTDADGEPVDADLLPTYAVTLPSGLAGTAPTVQHGGTGEYYVVYRTVAAGLHSDRFTAIVAGETITIPDSFQVEESWSSLVSVAEALHELRATDTITEPDDLEKLRSICRSATDAVERDRGLVLVRRTYSDTWDGGRGELKLRKRPPRPGDGGRLTMTSLTEGGVTLTEGTDFVVRRQRWTIARGTTTSRRCWAPGIENIAATYTAYCDPPPWIARQVCLQAVLRMWQVSQQMPHPAIDEISDMAVFAASASLTEVQRNAYDALTPALQA